MSTMSDHARTMRNDYFKGFALAVLLTVVPFALTAGGWLSPTHALLAIAALAVIQIAVHMIYFLHLDLRAVTDEKIVMLAFTGIILFLMVGGSLWVMFDLGARMM